MMGEEWRTIPGFDGWYDVSNLGRIRSWRTRAKFCHRAQEPRIVEARDNGYGYRSVKLTHPVLGKLAVMVHQAVLAAFVRHRPDGMVCDHINSIRDDNRAENLRWVTAAENIRAAGERGRMNGRPGARANSPLTEENVREIRKRRASGEKLKDIAGCFGVSTTAVWRAVSGRGWKDVA